VASNGTLPLISPVSGGHEISLRQQKYLTSRRRRSRLTPPEVDAGKPKKTHRNEGRSKIRRFSPGIRRDLKNWSKTKSTTENTEGTEKEA